MSFTAGTDAYARHVGRYGAALSAAHANAARLVAGDRALDVGCGPSVLLAELARRLGTDHVAGIDPSEPFAVAARAPVPARTCALQRPNGLPFETDAFDVASRNWS